MASRYPNYGTGTVQIVYGGTNASTGANGQLMTTNKKMITAGPNGGAGSGVVAPQGAFGALDPNPAPLYKPKVEPISEPSLVQKQANARMALARSQSDMQKAALLQSENESAYQQGLAPDSNAFKAGQQRAIDTAGQNSMGLMNEALTMNTSDLVGEQERQKAEKLAGLQFAMSQDNLTAEGKLSLQQQYGDLTGVDLGGTGTDGKPMFEDANTNKFEQGIQQLFKDRNLDINDPKVKALYDRALQDSTHAQSYVDAAGGSSLSLATGANDINKLDDATIKSILESGNVGEITRMGGLLEDNNTVSGWDKNATVGQVLMNGSKAYRVISDPKGKGKVLKDLSTGQITIMKDNAFYDPSSFKYGDNDYDLNTAVRQALAGGQ